MDLSKIETQIAKLSSTFSRELQHAIRDIRIDALYQDLLIRHVFNRPEPLAAMTGWSVAPEFAWWLYNYMLEARPRCIVELGSGISTLVIASAIKKTGKGRLIALEHSKKYYDETLDLLKTAGLDGYAQIIYRPLRIYEIDGEEYNWYDLPDDLLATAFKGNALDLVLVDGPPAATGRHARYPAHILLRKYYSENALVILDDSGRREEQEILARWQAMEPNSELQALRHIRHGVTLFYPRRRPDPETVDTDPLTGIITLAYEQLRKTCAHADHDELARQLAQVIHQKNEEYLNAAKEKYARAVMLLNEYESGEIGLINDSPVAFGAIQRRPGSTAEHGKKLIALEQQLAKERAQSAARKREIELLSSALDAARFETSRIKESLTYKVGSILLRSVKSPTKLLTLPYALLKAYLRYKNRPPLAVLKSGKPMSVRLRSEDEKVKGTEEVRVPDTRSLNLADGAVVDHLKKAAMRSGGALQATIARTASFNGRELLAGLASSGAYSYQQLIRVIEAYRSPILKKDAYLAAQCLHDGWAWQFANLLASQGICADDELNALSLCQLIIDSSGLRSARQADLLMLANLAVRFNRYDLIKLLLGAEGFAPHHRRFLEIDALHPKYSTSTLDNWLEHINRIFNSHSLEPIRLSERPYRTWFSRIESSAEKLSGSMPLVTVIVTAWRPGEELIASVQSILNQTWSNLELIIVDDASGPEFDARFKECERLDSRVTVLKRPINQGTYVARNVALDIAGGEFVTFQDSDDWSHPRRIERQVKPLLKDKRRVASRSLSIRCDDDVRFFAAGRVTVQTNASSLLFRREIVMKKIGYFDSVRKGADTEYILRIQATFPDGLFDVPDAPLALVRVASGSLSRKDFKPGWRHPARTSYRNAYNYWHKTGVMTGNGLFRTNDPVCRPFPAPLKFYIDRAQAAAESNFDIIMVGDWRQYGGPQKSMLEEIAALRMAGYRVAICHMEAFRFMTTRHIPLCEPVAQLLHSGAVREVMLDDEVTAGLVVLRYPPILQFTPAERCRWNIGLLFIVANQAPFENDGTDIRYHVGDCMRHAKELFGVDGIWSPQGPQVRKVIEPLVPPSLLWQEDTPGILDVEKWYVPRTRVISDVPVIGRYSRDNVLKFPNDKSQLLAAYPVSPDIRVRVMGGQNALPALLGETPMPKNWEILPYGVEPVKEFLQSIDFFVYFDSDTIVEAFGRSILEAIASGVVVILPPKYREVFGEAALYCEPNEVEGMIRQYHADIDKYVSQSTKAREVVTADFSYAAYIRKIRLLLSRAFA